MDPRTRKRAWNECLLLWRYVSRLKSCTVQVEQDEFKNNILRTLGIRPKTLGCPFCSRFFGTSDCPLGDCTKSTPCVEKEENLYEYSYYLWEYVVEHKNMHIRELAELFYKELLEKYEEEYGKEWTGVKT